MAELNFITLPVIAASAERSGRSLATVTLSSVGKQSKINDVDSARTKYPYFVHRNMPVTLLLLPSCLQIYI